MSVKFIRVTGRDSGHPLLISINKIAVIEYRDENKIVVVFDGVDGLKEIEVTESFNEVLVQLDGE